MDRRSWRAGAMEKSKAFYADLASEKVCVHCTHAKMRRDICGIYCKTGCVKNGKCAKFEEWKPRKGKKWT